MTALVDNIKDAMKDAMRAKDKQRLGAIRMLLAAIKQYEVDNKAQVDDNTALAIIDKAMKQRRESIKQYEDAGRADLADAEKAEMLVLQEFLPTPLTDEEIDALIAQAITQSGAETVRDMGKVMGLLKSQMQGRADMGAVSAKIKAHLS